MPVYPNFPAAFMYDLARDGTVVTLVDSGGTIQYTFTQGEVAGLSAWSSGAKGNAISNGTNGNKILALFPDTRQISAVQFALFQQGGSNTQAPTWTAQYSTDTTNGTNGAWTSAGSYTANSTSQKSAADLRGAACLFPASANGVKAVRVVVTTPGISGANTNFQAFSVWGTTQPTGLVMWHPSSDLPLYNSDNSLDRGDVYANQAAVVQQFRIKNTGAQTANSIVVGMDTTTTLTTLDTDTTFSLDGTNFAATQTISSITPGTISAIVHMKRGTPTDAVGSTRFATLRAVPGSWT